MRVMRAALSFFVAGNAVNRILQSNKWQVTSFFLKLVDPVSLI